MKRWRMRHDHCGTTGTARTHHGGMAIARDVGSFPAATLQTATTHVASSQRDRIALRARRTHGCK
jgi:hypothetical protein